MKKSFTLLICLLSMFISTAALATTSPANQGAVLLYNAPKENAPTKKLSLNVRLVPIFRQGNWVKVGDPRNGDTGWINMLQYEKARYHTYRPNIQTLFVRLNNNDKNGKPTLNVVAYRNGKPISKEEAMKLYQQLQQDQKNQFQQMQQFEALMDASFFSPSWMMGPGPIILIQTPGKNSPAPAKKSVEKNNQKQEEKTRT